MSEDTINKKIEEQGKILQELVKQSKRTQRTLNWLRIIGVIKVVVILAPIILAIIYLPPFVRRAIDKYEDVIPGLERVQEIIEGQGNNIL